MADQGQTDRAPWTVKGLPTEARELITRCARKRGVSVAEWVTNAAQAQANREASDQVIPPGQTEPVNGQTSVDLGELAELLTAIVAAQAVGVRGAKTAGSHAVALASMQLRQMRGLPSPARRLPIGHTITHDE